MCDKTEQKQKGRKEENKDEVPVHLWRYMQMVPGDMCSKEEGL